MPHLVVDVGNSYTKIAVFQHWEILWLKCYKVINALSFTKLTNVIHTYAIAKAIVSSVKDVDSALERYLASCLKLYSFSPEQVRCLQNNYLTPETLGLDRLANMVGVHRLYPNGNNLVVDAGTCLTYDFIDRQGNYLGGSISPGLTMRYKALAQGTRRLPLLKPDKRFNQPYGNDTAASIRSGVQNGLYYEVLGFLQSYCTQQGAVDRILLTGGDCNFFDGLLKNSIFAPYIKLEPYLVLKGLNEVIQTIS